jgi:hypothetical protein
MTTIGALAGVSALQTTSMIGVPFFIRTEPG